MRKPLPEQSLRTGGFPVRTLPSEVAGAVAVFGRFLRTPDYGRVKGETRLFDASGHVIKRDQVVAVVCGLRDQTRGQAFRVPLTLENKGPSTVS